MSNLANMNSSSSLNRGVAAQPQQHHHQQQQQQRISSQQQIVSSSSSSMGQISTMIHVPISLQQQHHQHQHQQQVRQQSADKGRIIVEQVNKDYYAKLDGVTQQRQQPRGQGQRQQVQGHGISTSIPTTTINSQPSNQLQPQQRHNGNNNGNVVVNKGQNKRMIGDVLVVSSTRGGGYGGGGGCGNEDMGPLSLMGGGGGGGGGVVMPSNIPNPQQPVVGGTSGGVDGNDVGDICGSGAHKKRRKIHQWVQTDKFFENWDEVRSYKNLLNQKFSLVNEGGQNTKVYQCKDNCGGSECHARLRFIKVDRADGQIRMDETNMHNEGAALPAGQGQGQGWQFARKFIIESLQKKTSLVDLVKKLHVEFAHHPQAANLPTLRTLQNFKRNIQRPRKDGTTAIKFDDFNDSSENIGLPLHPSITPPPFVSRGYTQQTAIVQGEILDVDHAQVIVPVPNTSITASSMMSGKPHTTLVGQTRP